MYQCTITSNLSKPWNSKMKQKLKKQQLMFVFSGQSRRRLPDLRDDVDLLRPPRPHPPPLLEDLRHRQKPAPESVGAKSRSSEFREVKDFEFRKGWRRSEARGRQNCHGRANQQKESGDFLVLNKTLTLRWHFFNFSSFSILDAHKGGEGVLNKTLTPRWIIKNLFIKCNNSYKTQNTISPTLPHEIMSKSPY